MLLTVPSYVNLYVPVALEALVTTAATVESGITKFAVVPVTVVVAKAVVGVDDPTVVNEMVTERPNGLYKLNVCVAPALIGAVKLDIEG